LKMGVVEKKKKPLMKFGKGAQQRVAHVEKKTKFCKGETNVYPKEGVVGGVASWGGKSRMLGGKQKF